MKWGVEIVPELEAWHVAWLLPRIVLVLMLVLSLARPAAASAESAAPAAPAAKAKKMNIGVCFDRPGSLGAAPKKKGGGQKGCYFTASISGARCLGLTRGVRFH